MDKFLNHIKFNLLNSIEVEVMEVENEKPFAFITDESRNNFASVLQKYIIELIIGYNTFLENPNNIISLREYLSENNIDYKSEDLEMLNQKFKLALDYYFANI